MLSHVLIVHVSQFVQPFPANGHTGCCQVSAIPNKTAVSFCVLVIALGVCLNLANAEF